MRRNSSSICGLLTLATVLSASTLRAQELSVPDTVEIVVPGAFVTNGATPNTISLSLDDVDLLDVVNVITRISGASIIANPSFLAGKRVAAHLTDVEWQPALQSILDMHSLSLLEIWEGSGVYTIGPRINPAHLRCFFYRPPEQTNNLSFAISVAITNATWTEAVDAIAREAQLNLAYDPLLNDTNSCITICLTNVTSDDALALVLKLYGLRRYRAVQDVALRFDLVGPAHGWPVVDHTPISPAAATPTPILSMLDENALRVLLLGACLVFLAIGLFIGHIPGRPGRDA